MSVEAEISELFVFVKLISKACSMWYVVVGRDYGLFLLSKPENYSQAQPLSVHTFETVSESKWPNSFKLFYGLGL